MDSNVTGEKPAENKGVLIVDDHPMIRYCLTEIVNRETNLTVTGEAEDVRSALYQLERENFCLAIVDLFLKNSYGFDLIEQMSIRYPCVKVLATSGYAEMIYVERALQAGADGFVQKDAKLNSIVAAVHRVMAGQMYLEESFQQHILRRSVQHESENNFSLIGLLNGKELKVFELTGQCLSSTDIAHRVGMNVHGVETYRTRIKHKLGLSTAMQLAATAGHWVSITRGGNRL